VPSASQQPASRTPNNTSQEFRIKYRQTKSFIDYFHPSSIMTMRMKALAAVYLLSALPLSFSFVVSSRDAIRTAVAAKKAKGDDEKSSAMDPAKRAALDGVLNQIERSYGRGSIVKLGDADNMAVACISSGSLTLDAALGGGIPKGRVVEIYGPESSGKTTLALHVIAECQKIGGTAAFVDAEHALDPSYGKFANNHSLMTKNMPLSKVS
jgi:hypothetical protein